MEILQMNSDYVIKDISDEFDFEIRMITENRMQCIPQCYEARTDGSCSLVYKTEGLVTLDKKYSRQCPDAEMVKALFFDLAVCLEEARDYFLSPEGVLIDIRHILYDTVERKYRFMYIPGLETGFVRMMRNLFEELMLIYDHTNREETDYLYGAYSRVIADGFGPEVFCKERAIFAGDEIRKSDGVSRTNVSEPAYELPRNVKAAEGYSSRVESMELGAGEGDSPWDKLSSKLQQFRSWLFEDLKLRADGENPTKGGDVIRDRADGLKEVGEKESREKIPEVVSTKREVCVMETSEYMQETSVLTDDVTMLVPIDTAGESIMLRQGRTRIGRQSGDAIIESPSVSRMHAEIEKNGKAVTVRDCGSTNGTFLNNSRIRGEEELMKGDIISFAGIGYKCM